MILELKKKVLCDLYIPSTRRNTRTREEDTCSKFTIDLKYLQKRVFLKKNIIPLSGPRNYRDHLFRNELLFLLYGVQYPTRPIYVFILK